MDYKKIIKSKALRLKILKLLRFIPDSYMIQFQYKLKTGRTLNLNNPKRYTEKLQWYKLNYRNTEMTRCADKYLIHGFVKEKGYGEYLNELYGVFDKPEEINFDELPNEFVIKTTNGSGTNIICKDKSKIDVETVKLNLKTWLNDSCSNHGREWAYKDIKSKIIIEKMLERDKNNDLLDYKFFCFDGKVECLYVMTEYTDNHSNGKLSFYDREFNKLKYRRTDYKEEDKRIEKPENFKKMVEIAENLSKGFPHVRVDLYNINGRIVFGELTFYTGSGYFSFNPDEYDYILGEKFKLEKLNSYK